MTLASRSLKVYGGMDNPSGAAPRERPAPGAGGGAPTRSAGYPPPRSRHGTLRLHRPKGAFMYMLRSEAESLRRVIRCLETEAAGPDASRLSHLFDQMSGSLLDRFGEAMVAASLRAWPELPEPPSEEEDA